MKCTCPKCRAEIEIDLPELPQEEMPASCPACKAAFKLYKESFGARALRKASELHCASCGAQLGAQPHCSNCGVPFPEYYLVSIGRKKGRRPSKKVKTRSRSAGKRAKITSQLPSLETAMKEEAAAAKPRAAVGARFSKNTLLAAYAVIFLLVAAAGGAFYLKKQAEHTYAKNFVLAVYCINTGEDDSVKASQRIINDWTTAGEASRPRLSMEEEKGLNHIAGRIDTIKTKITEEPSAFAGSNAKLAKLQASYEAVRSLVSAPGNSLPNFKDAVSKADVKYKLSVKEFKTGLPDEIMDELVSASKKFIGLRAMLK